MCDSDPTLPKLTELANAKRAFDAASGLARSDKLADKLAGQLTANPLPKDGKPYSDENLRKLSAAAAEEIKKLTQQAASSDKLREAAAKALGEECDAECMDIAIRACAGERRAPETGRAEGMAGPSVLPGLSWQTSFASGLGNFLKDRAVSEATLWGVTQIQEQLCGPALRDYFTNTCRLTQYVPAGTAPISGAIAATAIRTDLEELPLRVVTKQYPKWASPDSTELLTQALKGIRRGDSPLTLLAGMSADSDGKQYACFEDALACELRKIGSLVRFLGSGTDPSRAANEEPNFAALATDLAEGLRALQQNPKLCGKEPDGKHYLKSALQICLLPAPDPAKLEELLRVAHRLGSRLRQYSEQNLSSEQRLIASGELLQMTSSLMQSARACWNLEDPYWEHLERALDATALLLRGRYSEGTLQFIEWAANVTACKDGSAEADASGEEKKKTREPPAPCLDARLLQHVPLIVDIATAERPDDIESALRAAAAPVGSWRIKRTHTQIFAITSFVGGALGGETPVKGDGRPGTFAAGAIAALGIDASLYGGRDAEIGFLFSLLDVGQLLTTPIAPQEGTTDSNAKSRAEGGADIELIQILSPGAYAHVGIANSPLVLGVGYSIGPRLRRYETTTATRTVEDNFTVHRFLGFVAIDVTLFPL